jgi:hypothetical protein
MLSPTSNVLPPSRPAAYLLTLFDSSHFLGYNIDPAAMNPVTGSSTASSARSIRDRSTTIALAQLALTYLNSCEDAASNSFRRSGSVTAPICFFAFMLHPSPVNLRLIPWRERRCQGRPLHPESGGNMAQSQEARPKASADIPFLIDDHVVKLMPRRKPASKFPFPSHL